MSIIAVVFPLANAQGSAAAPPPGVAGGLLQTAFGLAIVLALIWGAAWLIRRVAPAARTLASPLKIVATQNVGPRERVVVIEIGSQWLVVGVAPGRVNALQTLPKSLLPEGPPPPNPFGRLLARAKGNPDA